MKKCDKCGQIWLVCTCNAPPQLREVLDDHMLMGLYGPFWKAAKAIRALPERLKGVP